MKERIVVDLPFDQVAACVAKVKEWLVSKGYKKTTERHPDRWSATTVLDITKGGVFGKKNMEATFKSYMGGNSIMIEFVGSHDGQGIGGKPIIDRGQDPKDRPFSNLANELNRFVKSTWKRDQGGPGDVAYTPPATQPSTMYQYDAPAVSSDLSTGYDHGSGTGYEEQSAYQQETGYDYETDTGYQEQPAYQQDAGYQEQPAYQQDAGYQEDAPGAYSNQVGSGPEPQPPSGEVVIPEGDISDEELAAIEAQLEAEEAAAANSTAPGASAEVPVEPGPGPEPTHDSEPTYDAGPEPTHDEPAPEVEPEPTHDEPAPEVEPEPTHDTGPAPDLGPSVGEEQPPAQPTCPGCGKNVKERWKTCPYCEYDLSGAPAEEPVPGPGPEGGQEAPACPSCGKPGTWIEDYQRFYCYDCENYL